MTCSWLPQAQPHTGKAFVSRETLLRSTLLRSVGSQGGSCSFCVPEQCLKHLSGNERATCISAKTDSNGLGGILQRRKFFVAVPREVPSVGQEVLWLWSRNKGRRTVVMPQELTGPRRLKACEPPRSAFNRTRTTRLHRKNATPRRCWSNCACFCEEAAIIQQRREGIVCTKGRSTRSTSEDALVAA